MAEKDYEHDDEDFNEKPSSNFKDEDEEHRHFDNLQRARDIRSA
jgi:hypothetical protein